MVRMVSQGRAPAIGRMARVTSTEGLIGCGVPDVLTCAGCPCDAPRIGRRDVKRVAAYLGLAIVFAWFFLGGVSHFTSPEFFLAIMPPWLPWHLPLVYISGALEIAFALLLLVPRTRELAGNLLILLTLAVTPVNVHMFLNPDQFPDVPPAFLTLRLVVQVLLLLLIWWSTRRARWAPA